MTTVVIGEDDDVLRNRIAQLLRREGYTVAPAANGSLNVRRPLPTAEASVNEATVLFSDIRNFTALADTLLSSEMAELLTRYFECICQPVIENGGRHLKFIGDGLMSVFVDSPGGSSPPAARRGVSAALGMALAAHEFRGWLDRRFAGRNLPPFAIGVGLHAGEVTLCPLGTIHHKETTPIGDTVNVAARLEAASKELGWTVVASGCVLRQAGEGVEIKNRTSLGLRGKTAGIEVVEITGLAAGAGHQQHGFEPFARHAAAVRHAVQVNSAIAARTARARLE